MSAGTSVTLLDHAQPAYVSYFTYAWCVTNALMLCLPPCLQYGDNPFTRLELKPESTNQSYKKPQLLFREVISSLHHRGEWLYC